MLNLYSNLKIQKYLIDAQSIGYLIFILNGSFCVSGWPLQTLPLEHMSRDPFLRKLEEGVTEKELCEAYPRLTINDIRAVMIFVADMIAHDELIITASSEGNGMGLVVGWKWGRKVNAE